MGESRGKALKRIYRDLKENAENPIEGITIYIPDNEDDLFNLHCEIKILYGIYKDIIVHTVIHIPNEYPVIGPAMNIMDDFNLPQNFHEHVLNKSICNDMLTNFKTFFQFQDLLSKKSEAKASGWSSGYSLNVIMSQMQVFFAEPDLPKENLLNSNEIEALKTYSIGYKCNGCKKKTKFQVEVTPTATSPTAVVVDSYKQRLICGMSKLNYFDDKSMILGYPLLMSIDHQGRLWPQALLELLSYEAYVQQIQQQGGINKLDNYNLIKFFSPNGDLFNYWIPIYINEEHFKRGYNIILNSLTVIRFGVANGIAKYDFKPDIVLEVLPCLINKTIVLMLNGTMHHSQAAIQAYCHFLRLYYKFLELYPQLKQAINSKVHQFLNSEAHRTKTHCPDLGEFIINLFLSDFTYQQSKHALIHEFFARQIFWIQKKKHVFLN